MTYIASKVIPGLIFHAIWSNGGNDPLSKGWVDFYASKTHSTLDAFEEYENKATSEKADIALREARDSLPEVPEDDPKVLWGEDFVEKNKMPKWEGLTEERKNKIFDVTRRCVGLLVRDNMPWSVTDVAKNIYNAINEKDDEV